MVCTFKLPDTWAASGLHAHAHAASSPGIWAMTYHFLKPPTGDFHSYRNSVWHTLAGLRKITMSSAACSPGGGSHTL